MLSAEDFLILPFVSMPWGQVFRYRKNWWIKTVNPRYGAVRVRKFLSNLGDLEDYIENKQFITIHAMESVATQATFIAKYAKHGFEHGYERG